MCCFIITIFTFLALLLLLLLLLLFVFGGNQSLLAFNFNIISSSKSRYRVLCTVQLYTHQLKIDSVVHMNVSPHALHIDAIFTVRSFGMCLFALFFVSSFLCLSPFSSLLLSLSCGWSSIHTLIVMQFNVYMYTIYMEYMFLKSETYPHGANYNMKIKPIFKHFVQTHFWIVFDIEYFWQKWKTLYCVCKSCTNLIYIYVYWNDGRRHLVHRHSTWISTVEYNPYVDFYSLHHFFE